MLSWLKKRLHIQGKSIEDGHALLSRSESSNEPLPNESSQVSIGQELPINVSAFTEEEIPEMLDEPLQEIEADRLPVIEVPIQTLVLDEYIYPSVTLLNEPVVDTGKINSRTILDVSGAETLLGSGDMLISIDNELQRAQCAFVSSAEVEKVVEFIAKQQGYPTAFLLPESQADDWGAVSIDLSNRDKMFNDCARLVVQMQSGSTSNIQRRFNLGYNRAGRIMDQLEAAGIVGPAYGSKPREVYYRTELELDRFLQSLN